MALDEWALVQFSGGAKAEDGNADDIGTDDLAGLPGLGANEIRAIAADRGVAANRV